MFICPKCKSTMTPPQCSCGYHVEQIGRVWQLTDMPDLVTGGNGDKYIGYEHIGYAYSGKRKYVMEDTDILFAKEISKLTCDGIFLDLACGDGCFTVPCAAEGTRIIAGDISNKMLSILMEKAKYNHIDPDNVTLCRMNALDIPLSDECVDTVVANSVLHLISNPQKVIGEIYRVLKKGGVYICMDDAPGKETPSPFDNTLYLKIMNSMYCAYWEKLKKHGVYPKKYNWKFDRNAFCDTVFARKTEKLIKRDGYYENTLQDVFLPRFFGRGFSDQVDVPQELHDQITSELLREFEAQYGDDFAYTSFKGLEQDILITLYHK